MQIKDRNTEFPNRRRLEVEEIEYNENGEIEVLLVEVKRDEGELYEEGTQINATNLDLIIRSKVTEILSMSDEERVEYDASKIELELEVDVEAITQDFSLPTKGINGSSIVWSVEGEGIEIEENIAKVNRKLYEQNPLLKARVSYGSAEAIQVFHVTVLLREMTPSERVEKDSNDLKIDTKVTTDFTLPSAGSNGSSITWVVKTGTSITITGNTANVHNGEIDAYSTLEATITYESVTTTKNFVVEVICFLPKTYAVSWTQEKGSLKTDELTIASSNGEKLYIEVENNYSSAIEVSIKANDSSLVKVEVKETTDLNAMMGTSYVEYTFTVHIYLSSDREIKLGSLNGSVKYYYASITPDD